jgi:uncharacterized membrane protein YkgB
LNSYSDEDCVKLSNHSDFFDVSRKHTPNRLPALLGCRPEEYAMNALMDTSLNPFVGKLRRSILLTSDLDYHVIRASMVIIFFLFGYQKWWAYEAERLVPFISNGPLISWLYLVFSHQGASWLLGLSEWIFGALLLAGFWDKRLGILGALGSTATFIGTVTIIPFMPDGWDPVAGFPAMSGNVPFLMKDVVLLAVSLYLLKQDLVRVAEQ